MRITRNQLRRVIREELTRHLFEQDQAGPDPEVMSMLGQAASVWLKLKMTPSVRAMVAGNIKQAMGYAKQGAPNEAKTILQAALDKGETAGATPGETSEHEDGKVAWNNANPETQIPSEDRR
jgi:hypothetical protein